MKLVERETNLGLAKSVMKGVTETFKSNDKLIVLEDDMKTSPFFLTYMNQALNMYSNKDKVASIHGYFYPISVNYNLPDTFFLRGADCWGWATWKNRWMDFEKDPEYLLKEIKSKDLERQFNFQDSYLFSSMLEGVINNTNDSWAILWHASNFIKNKLTLYPSKSFILNTGNDNSGVHSDFDLSFEVQLNNNFDSLKEIEIEESSLAQEAFKSFFRSRNRRVLRYFFIRLKNLLSKIYLAYKKND